MPSIKPRTHYERYGERIKAYRRTHRNIVRAVNRRWQWRHRVQFLEIKRVRNAKRAARQRGQLGLRPVEVGDRFLLFEIQAGACAYCTTS